MLNYDVAIIYYTVEYNTTIKNEDLYELICSHFQNIFLSEKNAREYKYTRVGYLLFNKEGI